MKTTILLALLAFTLTMGMLCGCKKDENHNPSNTDSLDLANAAYKQKLNAFLDTASGTYSVIKRTVDYCASCPPASQVKDSTYPTTYTLTVTITAGSLLSISVQDSSGTYSGQSYSFTSQLDCCPPLNENLDYDPDIRFNYPTTAPNFEHHVRFFPKDSVYVTFKTSGLGGASYNYYYGTKIP